MSLPPDLDGSLQSPPHGAAPQQGVDPIIEAGLRGQIDSAQLAAIADLEVAIAAANARAASATARRAAREAKMHEAMKKELLKAQTQLAAMDRAHEQQVAKIRSAAAAEVERLGRAPREKAR